MNGWEWVIWGYSFALVGLGAYGASIFARTRAVQQRITDRPVPGSDQGTD